MRTGRISKLMPALVLALAACSPNAADAGAGSSPVAAAGDSQPGAARVHRESGLAVIPLTVTAADGTVHEFAVELAESRFEQAKGLMFRREMGADEGMLFPMDPPREARFWMKNTVIPLDIIFIGADRRILNIAAQTVPYSEAGIPSDGVARAVLELNGGRAAELGIAAGDKVRW